MAAPPVSAAQVSAVLDMSTLAAFEQLLGGLSSADNAARAQYEALFNECKKQPDVLCLQLVRALRTSTAQETREMASILLRRVLTKDEVSLWANLQAQTQDGIKGELLKSIQENPSSPSPARCATPCASSPPASSRTESGPSSSPFSSECVTAGTPNLRESALNVFAQLAQYVGESLVPHLATLHGILAQCLQAPERPIQLAALRACCCFVESLENPTDRGKFQDLLPAMLATLGGALQGATRRMRKKRSVSSWSWRGPIRDSCVNTCRTSSRR